MSARTGEAERRMREFLCTYCLAEPGYPCVKEPSLQITSAHLARFQAATAAGRLPIRDGA